MSDELTPALTPEEWARMSAEDDTDLIAVELTPHGLAICNDDYYVGFTHYVGRPRALIALANECLRRAGHPGAITRAHVEIVRWAANDARDIPDTPLGEAFDRFAEILESILPPEP
jgi:hypothetical protein